MLARLLPAVRAVDGVVDVEGQLSYAIDDTRRRTVSSMTTLIRRARRWGRAGATPAASAAYQYRHARDGRGRLVSSIA